MSYLLRLLASQPDAIQRTCWARHCAVALNAIELVAAAAAGENPLPPVERPARGGGAARDSSWSGGGGGEDGRNWVVDTLTHVPSLSDPDSAPGAVKRRPQKRPPSYISGP